MYINAPMNIHSMAEDGTRCRFWVEEQEVLSIITSIHVTELKGAEASMEYAFLLLLMSRKKVFLFTLFDTKEVLYDEM